MNENVFFKDELLKKAGVPEELLTRLEALKVIQPAGVTEDKVPFYSQHTVAHFDYIKKLQEMGYGVEEIQAIVKKVGLPRTAGGKGGDPVNKKYLTIGGLATAVGVSARTLKHWEEKGIIEAGMRSDGGFRLFSDVYIYLCKLIQDLQLFGYSLEQIKTVSDLFRTFLAIHKKINTYSPEETTGELVHMQEEITALRGRMTLLKEGISRWEELVNKKSKEILALQKENGKRLKTSKEKDKKKDKKPADKKVGKGEK